MPVQIMKGEEEQLQQMLLGEILGSLVNTLRLLQWVRTKKTDNC